MVQSKLFTIGTGCLAFIVVFYGAHLFTLWHIEHEKKSTLGYVINTDDFKVLLGKNSKNELSTKNKTLAQKNFKIRALKDILIQLSEEIRDVKTHVRGTKARQSVQLAISSVAKLLLMTNTTAKGLKRQVSPSKHMCEEIFMGTGYGNPLYYKGFEIKNCSHATPLENIVTIVILHMNEDKVDLALLLQGIKKYNKKLNVIVGVQNLTSVSAIAKSKVVKFQKIALDFSYGKAWNTLVKHVRTEYTFIARNITHFDDDARIERLVYAIESLNVAVAGGASRDEGGFWKLGCYQTAYKNYSLIYEEGYDESLHECLFCDYINVPFLIKTETAVKHQFDDKLPLPSVFHDFFLRLSGNKQEKVVCPDSMFHIYRPKTSIDTKLWVDFATKYNLHRFKLADEFDMIFSCSNWKGNCGKVTGYALHPCCIQELTDIVKFFMKLCEESGIICELHFGTLLGAVKFGKTLPWELDADIRFLTANFTALLNLKPQIKKKYSFWDDQGKSLRCCAYNRTEGGIAHIRSAHWRVEVYGYALVDSEILLTRGTKPTKVLLDGQWVWGPRNPGMHARNAYGNEMYAHSQHLIALGINPRNNYQPGTFSPCKTPGRHDCLDNFIADGDLQFRILIP